MFKRAPTNNPSNRTDRYIVRMGKNLIGNNPELVLSTNRQCLFIRESGCWVVFSIPFNTPAFGVHIKHIASVVCLKKMRRVYTSRVITAMANIECWCFAVLNLPRYSVSSQQFIINTESPITVSKVSSPNPTFTRFINEIPKAVYNIFIHAASFVSTLVRGGVLATPRTRIITHEVVA